MNHQGTIELSGRRVAIVTAHPDDETIGAGGQLANLAAPDFILVTNGAPHDMNDAGANGFTTREAYAAARWGEFEQALRAGGVTPAEITRLGYTDQEAGLHLVDLTHTLAERLGLLKVDVVLTHPYEGGHPDHDATSFAVHEACRLLPAESRPEIVEFTSYHSRDGAIETGVFLVNSDSPETIVQLDPDARARKQAMLACYRTQQAVLRHFAVDEERFRIAPAYDFIAPPHEGPLFYEQFPWGMTHSRWAALAQEAIQQNKERNPWHSTVSKFSSR